MESGSDSDEDIVGNAVDMIDMEEAQKEKDNKEVVYCVHLRYQQRTTRKGYTIIEGMPDDIDCKKVLKAFKKMLNCNGALKKDKKNPKTSVILLQGDHRDSVEKFLLEEGIVSKEEIKKHGH
uniref:SUI1 domain-containing protein n=1 Tax=Euplotes harpa TaxID=151035 RepID=A0A7S3JMC0_9SPIT